MPQTLDRRTVLKGIGAAGVLGMAPKVGASWSDGRYIVNVGDDISSSDVQNLEAAGLDVVHELSRTGYAVVEGSESALDDLGYDYGPDLELRRQVEMELPEWSDGLPDRDDIDLDVSVPGTDLNGHGSAQNGSHPANVDAYNWDVDYLNLEDAHQINTGIKPNGEPVRVGIIDDGIYPDHPALNVVDGVDLTGDGDTPFHPNIDHYHGTHVAGIAAGGVPASAAAPTLESNHDIEVTDLSDPAVDPVQMAELLLGEEEGITIVEESVQYQGADLAGGAFSNAGDSVSIDDGVILSSGEAGLVQGPNDDPSTSTVMGESGDADLEQLAADISGGSPASNDAAVLEFDFEVGEDVEEVFLQYVFGSEEYNEWVGSQYNDVFAFFVNGENAATVPDPDSEDPDQEVAAAINSINNDANADLYIDNEPASAEEGVNDVVANTEMDGLTVPLTIEADVTPGEVNHLKMGIADITDSAVDSWVLVEAGSLGTAPPEQTIDDPIHGVAPDAELISLRYFGMRSGLVGNFGAAVEEAINLDCDVINSSLGFTDDLPESREYYVEYIQQFISDLASEADSNGIVWSGSAGNSETDANSLVPGSAKADRVLSVSSTGPTGIVRPGGEGPIHGDPLEPAHYSASYTTHGNEYVDVSGPGGAWNVYQGIDPTDYDQVREYVAPDGVLSSLPPDVVGTSLLLEYPLLPYSIPFGLEIIEPISIVEPTYDYDVYEGPLGLPHVNPEDTTGMTFLVSFSEPSHRTGWIQGTSMSAPQVTGLAALLKAEHPDWSPHHIRRVIRATARDVGKTTYHGHGAIDPAAALQVDDPEEVRDDLGRPEDRDDRGRNETRDGYSPRDASGRRGSGRGDDADDDGDEDRGR